MQIWLTTKPMGMLGINPKLVGKRLLSPIEKKDISQSLINYKGYPCLQRLWAPDMASSHDVVDVVIVHPSDDEAYK
jgi:hypothetical protein